MTEQPIGAALSRDIASEAGEKVEAEIDAFISRQHDKRVKTEGERDEEEAWADSERRARNARKAANRSAWYEFHTAQAARIRANPEALAADHEAEAKRLLAEGSRP